MLVALALGLVACSDSDGDAGTTTTAVSSTAAPTSASSTTSGVTTTTAATTTAATTTAAPATTSGGPTTPGPYVASAAFCGAVAELNQRGNIVEQAFGGDSTPTLARAAWDELDAVLDLLESESPALIEADVTTVHRAYGGLRAVFEQFGYDTQQMLNAASADPDLAAQLALRDNPEFQETKGRIDAFVSRACGG